MKIAISGKGGVGKTTIMAQIAFRLKELGAEVLVIDADSSPHMAQTLGVPDPERIVPIAEMKTLLAERSGKVEGSPFYNINPKVDDLMARFMVEHEGLRLMVLGAIDTGDSGCACAENTVLRRLLTMLLLEKNQHVLLDMEAGVEHLGRGTIAGVDHLLVVSIPAKSSIRTANKIRKLAGDVGIKKVSFIGNRVEDEDDREFLRQGLAEEPVAFLPDSAVVRKLERRGEPASLGLDETREEIDRILAAVGVSAG